MPASLHPQPHAETRPHNFLPPARCPVALAAPSSAARAADRTRIAPRIENPTQPLQVARLRRLQPLRRCVRVGCEKPFRTPDTAPNAMAAAAKKWRDRRIDVSERPGACGAGGIARAIRAHARAVRGPPACAGFAHGKPGMVRFRTLSCCGCLVHRICRFPRLAAELRSAHTTVSERDPAKPRPDENRRLSTSHAEAPVLFHASMMSLTSRSSCIPALARVAHETRKNTRNESTSDKPDTVTPAGNE